MSSSSSGPSQATAARKLYAPIDVKDSEGIQLLSLPEQHLCSNLRILPRAYLVIKETLLQEYTRLGKLKKREARKLIRMDVNKTGRVYDFFVEMGWFGAKT